MNGPCWCELTDSNCSPKDQVYSLATVSERFSTHIFVISISLLNKVLTQRLAWISKLLTLHSFNSFFISGGKPRNRTELGPFGTVRFTASPISIISSFPFFGDARRDWTFGPLIKSQMLYPTELPHHFDYCSFISRRYSHQRFTIGSYLSSKFSSREDNGNQSDVYSKERLRKFSNLPSHGKLEATLY